MSAIGKPDDFASDRRRMLKHDLKGRDITDPQVLRVMADVPRHEFVPREYLPRAYSDGPLPIGLDQTISQPYIVALMTQALRVSRDCHVLEIGTGSGYQTAVLARLAKTVYTIEQYAKLSTSAQAVLDKLGFDNIEFDVGDGSCGWPQDRLPEAGQFDRIMVTAAMPDVPEPLMQQLCAGGLIVAPVGYGSVQTLIVGRKQHDRLVETSLCGCRFVKLIGKYGFDQ